MEARIALRREPARVHDQDVVGGLRPLKAGAILPSHERESGPEPAQGPQELEKLLLEDGSELGATFAAERVVPVQEERGHLDQGSNPFRPHREGPRPQVPEEVAEVVEPHGGNLRGESLESGPGVSPRHPYTEEVREPLEVDLSRLRAPAALRGNARGHGVAEPVRAP